MKEIDLRSKNVGSYEYSFTSKKNNGDFVCLRDISYLENPIVARVSYEVDPPKNPKESSFWPSHQKLHEANFIVETFDTDLASFTRLAELDGDTARTFAEYVYCIKTIKLVPVISILAMDVLLQCGNDQNMRHAKDVDHSHEMYIQKAMLVHFLRGRLHMGGDVMVCKITQDSEHYDYSFYFSTKETYPTHIGIKISPTDEEGYFELISSDRELIRFFI